MVQKFQPPSERPDPLWEGTKTFVRTTAIWTGIGIAWDVAFSAMIDRGRHMGHSIRNNLPLSIAIASLFGVWEASKSYHEARRYNDDLQTKDMAERVKITEQLEHGQKPHHTQRLQAEKLAAEHTPETPVR